MRHSVPRGIYLAIADDKRSRNFLTPCFSDLTYVFSMLSRFDLDWDETKIVAEKDTMLILCFPTSLLVPAGHRTCL
jgi:hypothetical protein